MKRTILTAAAAVLLIVGLTACQPGKDDARQVEERVSNQLLGDLVKAHPVPTFDRSQLRQNLVEIVTAQADTTQTTTFFFNQGVTDPIMVCPSIGFPIPATSQLTAPQKEVGPRESRIALPQVEPTGIYTGDTAATYAICIDDNGDAYAQYWEGFINTVAAPARWDGDGKRIELVGSPTFEFSGNGG